MSGGQGQKPQAEKKFKKLEKTLDKPHRVWYNEYVRGREKTPLPRNLAQTPKAPMVEQIVGSRVCVFSPWFEKSCKFFQIPS